jgi:hypothetical protein
MRNINKLIRTWIVIIAFCLPFIATPTQGQSNSPVADGSGVKPTPAPANEPEVATELWPLTFVRSKIPPAAPGANGAGDSVDSLVTALNASFGQGSVTRSRQMLLITGTAKTRLAIKRLLTEYDLPWPQVQMNLWTVQVSGKPDQIVPKLLAIKSDIALTQAAMAEVFAELNNLINERKDDCDLRKRLEKLKEIGFDCEAGDALALNEALIIMALLNDPATIVYELDQKVADVLKNLENDGRKRYQEIKVSLKNTFALSDNELQYPPQNLNSGCKLKHTAKIYNNDKIYRARQAIKDFVDSLIQYRNDPEDPKGPVRLRRENAVVDRLLQDAIEAYALDMQQLFLDPLLLRIQRLNGAIPKRQSWGAEGVTLTSQSRMVVTSTMTTSLETEMASYANATRPKPFDVSTLFNTAFPRQERFSGLDSTPKPAPNPESTTESTATPAPLPAPDPQVLTGAQRIFGALGPGEAFLLAAALANDVEPNFHQVAPGISIKIQPTVLPDGGSARLAMECEFKVETEEFGNRGNDVWRQPFADAVKKHKVVTDTAVSVFDLFDISSFSLESSYPQAPYFVPVLGRLPVIGPIFQWPRDKKRVHHESIILVNTIILPRAMDLARFYGGN